MKFAQPLRSPSGFVNFGCLLIIVTIALIWGGAQNIYTGLKNREPLKMTFAEYQAQRPSAEWVNLTEAQLNLTNSAYVTAKFSDKVKEVYIAVEAVGNRDEKPAWVLLQSKDQALIDLMNSTSSKLNGMKSPGELTPELLSSLFPTREVKGLVKYGIDADSKTRSKLAKLNLSLESEFIIIAEGEEPSLGTGFGMLAGGLLLGFFLLRGKKEQTPIPAPQPPDLPPM